MCRTSRLLTVFLVFALHLNYALGNQLDFEIDPCDLMFHGRYVYPRPDVSDFPLARRLPIEFRLNYSIPEEYRPVAREAAAEWNQKARSRLITISDEIDYSEWHTQPGAGSSENIIYWVNEDQYKSVISRYRTTMPTSAMTAFSQRFLLMFSISRVLLRDSYIFINADRNTVMGYTRWLLIRHLNRMDVDYSEDMDTLELQRLFITRLSNMDSDDFYNMTLQLMKDKHVTLPNSEPEDIQKWIIGEINARMDGVQLLTFFEDFRSLMIEEYSDLTSIFNHSSNSILFKSNLVHEFGHALGLKDINGLDILMRGLIITPLPKFPRSLTVPQHVDNMALHGLSCSYNLEQLRQTLPL